MPFFGAPFKHQLNFDNHELVHLLMTFVESYVIFQYVFWEAQVASDLDNLCFLIRSSSPECLEELVASDID